MATKVTAFADRHGMLHGSADKATIADIMGVLGNGAIAASVLSKRAELEEIFAAHDAMLGQTVETQAAEAGAAAGLT